MLTKTPLLTIALCTFNGAAYLREQLDSYLVQNHTHWQLWVSDDGSNDATLDILQEFDRRHGNRHPVRVIKGPGQGVATNFMSLLCHPEFPTGPVALSDQDDVWLDHKLTRAIAQIQDYEGLVIYGAQSLHVDNTLRAIGRSRTLGSRPSFGNALVQNVISGHSCVLSAEALELVRRAGVPMGVPYHDWWLYLLISGAGGQVIVDDATALLYRQHDSNLMGAHRGQRARITRARQVLRSEYGNWVGANAAALATRAQLLDPMARQILENFREPAAGPTRIAQLRRLGIARQGRLGTACLYAAAALGRL
ncbi:MULTISPECIES: glycosyltransferase [Sulfitobacter]|uniref:Glycosyltransferase n=1 Tax=Sulfitobacter profundi TaxID=2679961 RepID=A0ABW1Z1P9_9RHOB|nr:glycosyltransferase [Sulfitobacter indolifex]